MGNQPRRDDPQLRARVAELHAAGHSRNAIARQVQASQATVTGIAQDLSLDFDRSRTSEATRAKVADAKASRAEAVLRFYHQVHATLDRLDLPQHHVKETSAGKVLAYTVDYLPAQDVKALLQAAGKAAQDAVRLEQVDADAQNLSAVDAWLDAIAGGTEEDTRG